MTLGSFAYHGYDWRVLTERMPNPKIVWVDVVWAFLRSQDNCPASDPITPASHRKLEPKFSPSTGAVNIGQEPSPAGLQDSSARSPEGGSIRRTRLDPGKLEFP
jgi:hypothetical protein